MRILSLSILLVLGSFELVAQFGCTPFQPSFINAEISLSSTSNLSYNGNPLPFGSSIVAIDADGNCCSSPIQWMGQDTTFFINGEDGIVEGYKTGEALKFLIDVQDACVVEATAAQVTVDGIPAFAFFAPLKVFQLNGLFADQGFTVEEINLIQPTCNDTIGSAQIIIDGDGPFDYEWSHDANLNTNQLFSLPLGQYSVSITAPNSCVDSIVFEIAKDSLAVAFEFAIDSTQGQCDTILVSNGLDCPICTYEWSNGIVTEENLIQSEGTYFVTITSGDCVAMDTLEVDFSDPPQVFASVSEDLVCEGDTVLLSGSGALSYQWVSNAEILNANSEMAEAVITEYSVIRLIGTNFCQSDTSLVFVDLFPLPTAGRDTCIARDNGSVQLNAEGAVDYNWLLNTAGPVSDPNIANPTATPVTSTDYIVEMLDENGCASVDSVFVEVIQDIVSFVPLYNVITPNGDGKNDVLFFDGLEKALANRLVVYDRWKKVVYESDNYQNDWDGSSSGKALPAGSYFYILEINGIQMKNKLTIIYE